MQDYDRALDQLRLLCDRIAQGNYSELDELFAMTGDGDLPAVVSQLAEAFGSMAVQIEAREFHLSETLADLREAHRQLADIHRNTVLENEALRGTVEQLKVEIDQGKRDREVAEIADTDYFQLLQKRAQEMRTRRGPARDRDA